MRGVKYFRTALNRGGRGLMSLLALLAIALHVFTIEGHVHVAAFTGAAHSDVAPQGAVSGGGAAAKQSLANPTSQAPCVFCQTMASAGAGLLPAAPPLVWFGAAALIAALFGQRRVSLQRLHAWRSRAPPLFA